MRFGVAVGYRFPICTTAGHQLTQKDRKRDAMANSTKQKPDKPRPDFPLYPHDRQDVFPVGGFLVVPLALHLQHVIQG